MYENIHILYTLIHIDIQSTHLISHNYSTLKLLIAVTLFECVSYLILSVCDLEMHQFTFDSFYYSELHDRSLHNDLKRS